MVFVGREQELQFLGQAANSERAELMVVYGRRRVGKTTLLRHFCSGRKHSFWVATLSSEVILRQDFTRALWQVSRPDGAEPGFVYDNWESAFRALGNLAQQERLVMVIDEFPYLVSANPAIPSILQKVWDEQLQHSQLMLILCGSHLGMMERELLLYHAPLYGRRTGQIQLRTLSLTEITQLFPNYSAIEQLELYAVLGGVPAYLAQFDPGRTLLANIEQRILDSGSYLYLEPQFLLREELQEPRNYFAILQAIAHGRTQLNEIGLATGLGRQSASRYLAVLQEIQLIERRVPVTESQPEKSRRGIYRLADPFLRFWFRFVTPNVANLEMGQRESVIAQVQQHFNDFIAPIFEDVCRAWVMQQGVTGHLPFQPARVGGWWDKENELDVLAIGEGGVLVGECKWSTRPVGSNILDDLKRKTYPLIQQYGWPNAYYALFSRAGFSSALQTIAQEEGILLVAPHQLT